MDLLLTLIDMRSFSNLWYWIALAVVWSSTSHWVLGVPFDMVIASERRGGRACADLVAICRINVARLLFIGREAGLALTVFVSFALSSLVLLGWVYRAEFAQALALIVVPMSLVGLLSLRAAKRIEPLFTTPETNDPALAHQVAKALARHRVQVQLIGMVSISVTALWGMFQNLSHSVLN